MSPNASLVAAIRLASRRLVRELGFMNRSLAGTDMGPSAIHAVIELGRAGRLTATELGARLLLEKSTVSRLVQSLRRRDLVAETLGASDRRSRRLALTDAGRDTLAAIDRFADRQVNGALAHLPGETAETIHKGIAAYADALAARRGDGPAAEVEIVEGYRPGVLGEIATLHGAYYARRLGFGAAFEAKVAAGLAEFAGRLDSPANRLWTAVLDGRTVASIAIDGEDLATEDFAGGRAHLRWFIVADGLRGAGLGRRLLGQALAFCDEHGFRETWLWTVPGLEASRHLYEMHGFYLAETFQGNQWGHEATEQIFRRSRGAAAA